MRNPLLVFGQQLSVDSQVWFNYNTASWRWAWSGLTSCGKSEMLQLEKYYVMKRTCWTAQLEQPRCYITWEFILAQWQLAVHRICNPWTWQYGVRSKDSTESRKTERSRGVAAQRNTNAEAEELTWTRPLTSQGDVQETHPCAEKQKQALQLTH